MNTTLTALVVFGCLSGAVLLGRIFRRLLPENHLSADSRDTIKLALGLVATMAALVLGLLINSAKGTYEAQRAQVIEMSAKASFLDRLLSAYGPEAKGSRALFRSTVENAIHRMWPQEGRMAPVFDHGPSDELLGAIESLSPTNETQRTLKTQSVNLVID